MTLNWGVIKGGGGVIWALDFFTLILGGDMGPPFGTLTWGVIWDLHFGP
jgi:hypothetical protein